MSIMEQQAQDQIEGGIYNNNELYKKLLRTESNLITTEQILSGAQTYYESFLQCPIDNTHFYCWRENCCDDSEHMILKEIHKYFRNKVTE